MRRNTALISALTALVLFLFASCILRGRTTADGPAESVPPEKGYTITYYLDGQVLNQEKVPEGGAASAIPEGYSWRNENGFAVEPASLAITRDMSFYAGQPIFFRTGQPQYFPVEGDQFLPDELVRRGQAAQMLAALLDPTQTFPAAEEVLFSDVPESSPCYESVQKLAAFRILHGYGDGTFRPDQEMTRGELLTALCRLAGGSELTETSFPDVPQDHWSREAVAFAASEGWIFGMEDGQFYTDYPVTRAEAVVMISRVCGREPNKEGIDLACRESPYADVSTRHWAYYYIIDASYRNALLSYVLGEEENIQPGLVFIDEQMAHVNPDTMALDSYEKGFHVIADGLPTDGLYYVPEKGFFFQRFQPGLQELDSSMFYVEKEDGPFVTSFELGYLYFGENGRYTSGDTDLDGYVNAALSDIIQGQTSSLLSEEKLRQAYDLLVYGDYSSVSRSDSGWPRGSTNWAASAAKGLLKEKEGDCFSWAGAFLQLARRLGFQAYPVCGGVGTQNTLHAWVMIDGEDGSEYLYDALLDWSYRQNNGTEAMDMFKQPRDHTNEQYIFPGDDYEVAPGEEDLLPTITWPTEPGGLAYVEENGEKIGLPTTWLEQYDDNGNLTGYLVSVTYNGVTYSNTIPLSASSAPTETPGQQSPDHTGGEGTTTAPEATETAEPESTETAEPESTETAEPESTETAEPKPTETVSPVPSDGQATPPEEDGEQ